MVFFFLVALTTSAFLGWFGAEFVLAECLVAVFVEFEEGFGRSSDLAGGEFLIVILIDRHDDGIRWRTFGTLGDTWGGGSCEEEGNEVDVFHGRVSVTREIMASGC